MVGKTKIRKQENTRQNYKYMNNAKKTKKKQEHTNNNK